MSLSAKVIRLKGANGNEAKFVVEEVTAEGVRAQPENSYQTLLIRWEQIDLKWLQQQQPGIWQQKQQIEALAKFAYEGFYFGQSRNEVSRQIVLIKAARVPAERFGDTASHALWVCTDPGTLRRFIRFSFDQEERLCAIEVHMNFAADEAIDKGMQTEWERVIQMVDRLDSESVQGGRFPSSSTWRQTVKSAEKGGERRFVTHTWSDALREIELCLEAKRVELSVGEAKLGGNTAFGMVMDTSNVIQTKSNTNWVVYKAKLK